MQNNNDWQERFVCTPHGLYKEASSGLFRALFILNMGASIALSICVLAMAWRQDTAPLVSIIPLFLLIIINFFWLIRERKKASTIISIIAGMLVFHDRVQKKKALSSFMLKDLNKIIIYGASGRRTYRIINKDNSWKEVTPLWGKRVEEAVEVFLRKYIPAEITIEEPQEIFAQVRGDGPYPINH